MRKKQYQSRRFTPTSRHSPTYDNKIDRDLTQYQNRALPQDIRQQLRVALEELQHHRLTSDLEVQKRMLLEQQIKNIKQQYEQEKQQKQQLRKELNRLSKKYGKAKQKKECERCKVQGQQQLKNEKERQIYINDRKMLQQQIKNLKLQVQQSEALKQRQKLLILVDSLKKQLYLSSKKLEQQGRIIQFMNDKLSYFQVQNVQIMNNLQILQNKLSQIEIDSVIRKKQNRQCANCSSSKQRNKGSLEDSHCRHSLGKKRRNGSIQNMKRAQRDQGYAEELQRYQR